MHIPTSQLRDGHVFLALQVGHLPLLAGEQQYLAPLAFLQQVVQRCVEPLVVEGHQRVIQNEGHPLVGGQDYSCGFMCDVIHLTGAKSLGVYAEDFYAGTPCICENSFGAGRAIYIGTKLEAGGVDAVLDYAVQGTDVAPVLAAPAGVEICLREGEKHGLLFLVNNTTDSRTVAIPSGWEALAGEAPENGVLILSGKGSAVLLRK